MCPDGYPRVAEAGASAEQACLLRVRWLRQQRHLHVRTPRLGVSKHNFYVWTAWCADLVFDGGLR